MRAKIIFTGFVFLLTASLATAAVTGQRGGLPFEFEANRGQFEPQVLFLARTAGHFVYLTHQGMTFGANTNSRRGAALEMKLVGANPAPEVTSEKRLAGVSNYLIGNDPAQWHREVPHFARIRYRQVWPGIDVIFRGGEEALEYDLEVAPGADPSAIRLRFANASGLRVDGDGNLSIDSASGQVVQRLPAIYQEKDGKRSAVRGEFRVSGEREIRFAVGAYDRRRPLVIDPTISYANYIGGTGTIAVAQVAVDGAGNAYLAGSASSPDFPLITPVQSFPTSVGLFNSATQGANWGAANSSIGTAKVLAVAADPGTPATAYAGTSRGVFKTTNMGGAWAAMNSGLPTDAVTAVAVDPLAPSTLYACTPEGTYKSTNAAATWTILPSVGSCQVVAVDPKNEGVVWFGYSFFYPIISLDGGKTALQANFGQIQATSIAIDPNNPLNVFFGTVNLGVVMTANDGLSFTTVSSGLQATSGSSVTVNAVALDRNNTSRILVGTNTGVYLSASGGTSFVGTSGVGSQPVLSVIFDPKNDSIAVAGTAGGGVYVSGDGGQTWTATGPANLAVTALAMSVDESSTWAGLYSGTNAFVTKINAAGTAEVYSTYLGGNGATSAYGIAADSAGHAFVCGQTIAANFPVQNAFQPKLGGGVDMFIARLNTSGSSLDDATYLGGHADDTCNAMALDSGGNVYVAGTSILLNTIVNSDFPTSSGVLGPLSFGGQDCVVAKFNNTLQNRVYSTFLGGNNSDSCYGIAADSAGNAYVVGETFSSNFLVTHPPFGGSSAGGSQTNIPAFISEISPDGSALIYSGLVGGAKGESQLTGIAVNSAGRAFTVGFTQASDYPFTSNALNTKVGNVSKTVVTAVEAGGASLVYSTALPGAGPDIGNSIAVDASGNVWIGGEDQSGSFPVTSDAFPHTPKTNAFTPYLAELGPTGSTLLHATYLGGSGGGGQPSVALASDGSVYAAGTTLSTDFPLTGTPFGKAQGADYNVYVTHLGFGASGTPGGPAITSVQNGASFQNGFAAGSWMTIKGSNLSSVTDTWGNAIVNNQLPTKLDGVSVSIGGQPAYIYYVSAGQINVIAPNIAPGSTTVTVTNSLGTSAAFTATVQAEQPAFFQIGATAYAVASHYPDYSLALKNGTISGATTVAAAPGDVIILWGTGFGPTNPAAAQGVVVPSGAFPTVGAVTVTVGNQMAIVYGTALATGQAAEYQVAIQIPTSLADGDYPVVATIDGLSSPATTLITVQHQ